MNLCRLNSPTLPSLALGLLVGLAGCETQSPLTPAEPIGEYPVWGQDFQKKAPTTSSLLAGTGGHGDVAAGKNVFLNKCALCHGPDAKGKEMPGMGLVPDLTAAALQSRLTDDKIRLTVKQGKGKMPPQGDALSDKEIADVAAYVRSLGPQQAPSKDAPSKDAPSKDAPSKGAPQEGSAG